jgi:aminomethyltransferase
VRWLNGMVTNSIQQLAPGQGCYNFVLNAQGRIQGDLTAFAQPDSLLLETDRERLPALIALLDHFIIMDDVELADIGETRRGILVAGPQAASLLETLGLAIGPASSLRLQAATWNSAPLDIVYGYSPLVARIELWADPLTIDAITAELIAAGAAPIESEAVDQLRILSGTPRYGTDIRNTESVRDLPQETGQTRALHFSKGCYLGQEIVERIHSRGNVHRAFTGFELTGDLPAAGAALQADGKLAGELTSVAAIQLPASAAPIQLALGYVRREALERGQPLEFPGGQAKPIALPYAIPWIQHPNPIR